MSEKIESPDEKPLESWKEIAAYLKRDVRTVIRWEKSEGLPVHRHMHQARRSVYAYPSEISAWSASRKPRREEVARWRRTVPSLAFAAVLMLSLLLVADAPFSATAAAQAAGQSAMTARRIWGPGPDEVEDSGGPSPDGRYLSYVDWGNFGDLSVRDLTTGETRHLTNGSPTSSGEAYHSVFSPDGQQVAYAECCRPDLGDRYDLRVISFRGEAGGAKPRVLLNSEDVSYVEPTDWSQDGKQILATIRRKDKTHQLVLISASDGSRHVLKTLDWRWPAGRFSPDGRYIAYDFPAREDSPDRDIFVLATDGSREIPLVEHAGDDYLLGWASDGKRILFASDRTGTLGAWLVDVADGMVQGAPALIKRDIGPISPLGLTPDGSFYYSLVAGTRDIYIATFDPSGGTVTAPPTPASQRFMGANTAATWSPDGRYLAYLARRGKSDVHRARFLVIRSAETNQERDLSTNLSFFYTYAQLRWSLDGRFLLARARDNKGRDGYYRIDAKTGESALVLQGEEEELGSAIWSSDEKGLFYVDRNNKAVLFRDLDSGREKEVYRQQGNGSPGYLALSPDGRWLAFAAAGLSQPASPALLVMPAGGGNPREVLKAGIGALEWTPDGSQLLFRQGSELWRIPAEGGEPRRLGLTSHTGGFSSGASLSVHPDGRRIAFSSGEQNIEVWVLENFLPGLK
jgi:Tol biopolymer transport system component